MTDHTSNPKDKRRMRIFKALNELWDNEYNSTKLLITADVLDKIKEMYHICSGKHPNPNENIQRVEITSMVKHFNKLKNSEITFDTIFYNELTKAVGQNYFVVKGFFNMEFKSST